MAFKIMQTITAKTEPKERHNIIIYPETLSIMQMNAKMGFLVRCFENRAHMLRYVLLFAFLSIRFESLSHILNAKLFAYICSGFQWSLVFCFVVVILCSRYSTSAFVYCQHFDFPWFIQHSNHLDAPQYKYCSAKLQKIYNYKFSRSQTQGKNPFQQ